MTISTTASQSTTQANSATTVWNFSFVAGSASNIFVTITNSSGQQTTLTPSQFTVALNPAAAGELWGVGGFVTYPLSGPPLATGNSITIQRILPLTQQTSISNQGDFYPTVTEEALDTLCMEIQDVSARTGQLRGTWITGTLYNFGDIVVDGVNGNDTGNLYTCAISNTSGTWSTDLANGDWSLALNVQGIVNALPSIANNQVLGNISGVSATAYGVGVSALIDSVFGSAQGSLLYRSGSAWTVLTPGTNGQVLKTQGSSANPQWGSISGAGTVTSVATGSGLTGGPVTSSGTISFASVADMSVLANISGSSAAAGATTLTSLLDYILGSTQGSLIYRAGSVWTVLGPGTNGQVLTTQGAGANPQWAAAGGGSGSLTSPGNWTYPGGFIEQWGSYTGGSAATITYPIAFPTAVFGVFLGAAPSSPAPGVSSVTTTNFSLNSEGQNPVYWRAIGH